MEQFCFLTGVHSQFVGGMKWGNLVHDAFDLFVRHALLPLGEVRRTCVFRAVLVRFCDAIQK
jgi:hypothetical protein